MDTRKINRKLSEYCQETVDEIRELEWQTKIFPNMPFSKQFPDYGDAAACNLQENSDFNQEQAIKLAILKWGRKILQHLAIKTPIKFNDLLGLYMKIKIEMPHQTKAWAPINHAMFESTDLFDKGQLTLPIATRILTAGLQNFIYEQSLQTDSDIKLLLVSLNNGTSGVTLPYQKAHIPIIL